MTSSRRRPADPQSHVVGRYHSDTPLPAQRGRPGERPRCPDCILLAGLLAAVASAALTTLVALFLLRPAASSTHNAIWLGIRWGEELHTDEEVHNLANELRFNGIETAYVWVSWLQEDGTWSETTFANMGTFVRQFRDAYPEARLLAWIGLPVEVPEYRLDDSEIRSEVADFSLRTIEDFGFDGVHLNAEPVWNEDENFPALLREIRQVLGEDISLSVAVPPDWNTGVEGIPVSPLTTTEAMWSQEYKQRVALLADEIVVMAYNSGLSSPLDYQVWMAFQVAQFTSAIVPLGVDTRLIIGIPTYDAELPGHDPAVESLPAAITGVRNGMTRVEGASDLVQGVGLYAYWSTEPPEWATYRELWLGDTPHP